MRTLFGLFYLVCLSCCVSEDVEVCVYWETCVLPCAFPPGDDPVIHWTKEPEDAPVHIYYKNQHQHQHQHENYTGRTSLSDQGILQLHEVRVSDEGRYKCYVSTIRPDNIKESFVTLKVYAPVPDVSVRQEGPELICSSERIYPEPKVDWTPLSSDSYQTQTSQTEDALYTVYSSVRLSPNSAAESLTCNISTPYSWRNATVTPQALDNQNLHYLWPWTLVILIPMLILVTVVVLLIYCYRWKISKSWYNLHRRVEEPARVPLEGPEMPLGGPKMPLGGPKMPLERPEMSLEDSEMSLEDSEMSLGGREIPLTLKI